MNPNGQTRLGPNAPTPYVAREPEPSAADIAVVDRRIANEKQIDRDIAELEARHIEEEKRKVRDSGFLGTNHWHETHSSWAWKNSPDRYRSRGPSGS